MDKNKTKEDSDILKSIQCINNSFSNNIDEYLQNASINDAIINSIYYKYICDTYINLTNREQKLLTLSCLIYLFIFFGSLIK